MRATWARFYEYAQQLDLTPRVLAIIKNPRYWCEYNGKAFAKSRAWKIVAPSPPVPSLVTT
jgi:hypothetical protein